MHLPFLHYRKSIFCRYLIFHFPLFILPSSAPIYETAFPVYERRTWPQLQSMLSLPNMHVVVAKQNEEPVGFCYLLGNRKLVFSGALAIHPLQAGKGFGSKLLQHLVAGSNQRLLLEAELPTDEISRRRTRFYKKAGLQPALFSYLQPPYRRGESAPDMHILSVPAITDEIFFTGITTAIRQQVFEAFY